MPDGAEQKMYLTYEEFCTMHRMSRTLLYQLFKRGTGPRIMRVGGRRFITHEAAAEWRKKMESGE